MRALRVGDLVLLREEQADTFVKHHGAGIVTRVQKFNQEYKYPHITVKWLRSEESLKFLEKDLMKLDDS